MIKEVPIRCHRCGIYKLPEDTGIFFAWNPLGSTVEYISWFHNEECLSIWKTQYAGKFVQVA